MKDKPNISLFFPAYNEEENIKTAVFEADKVLKTVSKEYEIIVINDGSKDSTGRIADELARTNSKIRVIHHNPNKGYGAALWSGIQASKYDWIFFTDADIQFHLSEISRLIEYIPDYDIVLGFREHRQDSWMRLLNAKVWNILNRIFFGLKVRDIDCAFKLMKRDLVNQLPLETRGAMMSAEMLIRLQRAGIEFKEVGVTHLPRLRGSATGAKPQVIARAIKEMYNLYRGPLGHGDNAYVQAGKFGIVGVVNTLVDVITYFLLTRYTFFFASHILSAKFLTFFLGTVCSFVLNRYYTFNIRGKISAAEVIKFYSTIILTVSVNVGTLYVLNTVLGIHDLIAVAMSTLITFVAGFTISRLWVFKKQVARPIKNSLSTFRKKLNTEKIDWSEIARSSNDI